MKKQRNIKKQKKNGRPLTHSHQHHDVHISNDNNTASSCVRKKRRKNKGHSLDGRVSEHGDTAMDDILAQLQRQREKKKQQQSKEDETSSGAAASIPVPQHHDDTSTISSSTASFKQTQKTNVLSGKYHYDPTTKRYYPSSTLKSNGNNDVCIQRIQEKKQMLQDNMGCKVDGSIKSNNSNNMVEDGFLCRRGAVADEDIRRIIFRGSACLMSNINEGEEMSTISLDGKRNPIKKKQRRHNNVNHLPTDTKTVERRRRIPCTERTSQLLSTSLQYCANIQKRRAVSSMLGPMSVARKAKIVSTSSTLEDVKRNTKLYNIQSYYSIDRREEGLEALLQPFAMKQQQFEKSSTWLSILFPLWVPQNQQEQLPYDCICKSYLQPTSSTFDVLPNSCSTMPHVATILNDSIFYRESRLIQAWKVGW